MKKVIFSAPGIAGGKCVSAGGILGLEELFFLLLVTPFVSLTGEIKQSFPSDLCRSSYAWDAIYGLLSHSSVIQVISSKNLRFSIEFAIDKSNVLSELHRVAHALLELLKKLRLGDKRALSKELEGVCDEFVHVLFSRR